jgi:hypothetical protein
MRSTNDIKGLRQRKRSLASSLTVIERVNYTSRQIPGMPSRPARAAMPHSLVLNLTGTHAAFEKLRECQAAQS